MGLARLFLPLPMIKIFFGLFVLAVFPFSVTQPAPRLADIRGPTSIYSAAGYKWRPAFMPTRLINWRLHISTQTMMAQARKANQEAVSLKSIARSKIQGNQIREKAAI